MSGRYILDGDSPVFCPDLMTWARWFETAERHLGKDTVGDAKVSTVFLGLDHSYDSGPPLLWETMIFGGQHDGYQELYATREAALAGHQAALKLAAVEPADADV